MDAIEMAPSETPEDKNWRLFLLVGDLTAQRLLCHLCTKPLSVHELVVQLDLPQTTVYQKLHELVEMGAVKEYPQAFPSQRGREGVLFESRITGFRFQQQEGQVEFRVKWREGTEEVRKLPMERLSALHPLRFRPVLSCNHPGEGAPPETETLAIPALPEDRGGPRLPSLSPLRPRRHGKKRRARPCGEQSPSICSPG